MHPVGDKPGGVVGGVLQQIEARWITADPRVRTWVVFADTKWVADKKRARKRSRSKKCFAGVRTVDLRTRFAKVAARALPVDRIPSTVARCFPGDLLSTYAGLTKQSSKQ